MKVAVKTHNNSQLQDENDDCQEKDGARHHGCRLVGGAWEGVCVCACVCKRV